MLRNPIFVLISIIITFASCQSSAPFEIKTGSFKQALAEASEKKKELIAIISMKDCTSCTAMQEGWQKLAALNPPLKNYVFYEFEVDEPANQWFEQLYFKKAYPITCVFSPEGKLINVIVSGSPNKVMKALHDMTVMPDSAYVYSKTRLNIEGKPMVEMLDTIWQVYRQMQDTTHKMSGQEMEHGIANLKQTIKTDSYFFNNYLLTKLYQLSGDSLAAKSSATAALDFRETLGLVIYRDQRSALKKYLDPSIDTIAAPIILFDKQEIDLGANEEKHSPLLEATFQFRNVGAKPLLIDDIVSPCGCVTPVWDKKEIPAGGKGTVTIQYREKNKGVFEYAFHVVSNAENSPHLISIKGKIF